MKSVRLSGLLALGTMALVLSLAPGRAMADLVVVFDSNSHVLSGKTPGGTGTWAEAIFTRLGDHEVQVEFMVPSNAVPGLYLDAIGFQFNTSTRPTFSHVSGATASGISFSKSGIAVPGTGHEEFNTDFNFPNSASKRVKFGQDSVYDITFSHSSPALAKDLNNLFKLPDASCHDDFAAAHLAGYNGKSSGLSGHFPLHLVSVPEPSTLVLSSVGGIFVMFLAWYRRRRSLA